MKLELTPEGTYFCPDDPGEAGYLKKLPRRSVSEREATILRAGASGKNVLEIGTGLGVATRAMAVTARWITSVDIDPWCHSFEFPDNVTLLAAVPKDLRFDVAFIDGHHGFESVFHDIILAEAPLLFMHDCYLRDVRNAITAAELQLVKAYRTECQLELYRKPE